MMQSCKTDARKTNRAGSKVDRPLLRRRRARLGRVTDAVAPGREHDEDNAGDGADDDGQRHDHLLLLFLERRVEARHRVGVGEQRHRREHGHGEGRVHEVGEPQPVLGEVRPPGGGGGGGAAFGEGKEAPGRT